MSFSQYVKEQARLHPTMQMQDAMKLCYQAAFGAEHAITEPAEVKKYLRAELKAVKADAAMPLYECISDSVCRVNLPAWKARKWPVDWLFRMFTASARRGGAICRFQEEISLLAGRGELPFEQKKWDTYVKAYMMSEPRPVHHSDIYRETEKPAYRLVSARFLPIFPILEKMAQRPDGCVVAIDGRAASGKTSLAALLVEATGAGVVHVDDFCSPGAKMQVEKLGLPGGNIRYDMIMEDVLPNLRSPKAFFYRSIDCAKLCIGPRVRVARSPYRVVEGSFSQHPVFGDYFDIAVFMDVSPEEQLRRIIERDGQGFVDAFARLWIPMEEEYIKFFSLKDKAHIVI